MAPSTNEFYQALLDDNPQDLYDNAPCGYLSTAPDGTIVKVNETFLAWTAFDRDELVGRRLADLLTSGGRIFFETHVAPMLRMQGRAREIAVDVRGARGGTMPVLLSAVLVRDRDDKPAFVRFAIFDATERRAYELELLAARRQAEASEARARQLAQTLQASLIPPALPEAPHLHLSGAYRPAGDGSEVGGDFYDVFENGDGSWTLTIGDVCGKGVDAAVVTSLVRHTIRAATYGHQEPHRVLQTLNNVLLRESPDRFCTVGYLRVVPTPDAVTLTSVSAGHPRPIIATADDAIEIGSSGPPVGIFPDVDLEAVDASMPANAILAMYTDGCIEARSRDGEFFGEDRLHQALCAIAARPPFDPAAAVCDTIIEFQHGNPRDDIALLIARRLT